MTFFFRFDLEFFDLTLNKIFEVKVVVEIEINMKKYIIIGVFMKFLFSQSSELFENVVTWRPFLNYRLQTRIMFFSYLSYFRLWMFLYLMFLQNIKHHTLHSTPIWHIWCKHRFILFLFICYICLVKTLKHQVSPWKYYQL